MHLNYYSDFYSTGTGFTVSPQNSIQAEGIDAIFQCQYVEADAVGWIINGTSVHTYNPPNVTINILDESIHELTILALPNYNGTELWCVATIIQNEVRVETSSRGKLIVQGTRWITPFKRMSY